MVSVARIVVNIYVWDLMGAFRRSPAKSCCNHIACFPQDESAMYDASELHSVTNYCPFDVQYIGWELNVTTITVVERLASRNTRQSASV